MGDVAVHRLRILPLGDSITYGGYGAGLDGCGGYRPPLWRALREDGLDFTFVGSQSSGPPWMDKAHEGHKGLRIDEIHERVKGRLGELRPDVILLHAGTNDLVQRAAPAQARDRMEAVLDCLRTEVPEARVLVAAIIGVRVPNDYDVAPAEIGAYNVLVGDTVAARARAGERLTLVDMERGAGLTDGDHHDDGLHPNDSGYAKLAAAWREAIARTSGLEMASRGATRE